jgi:hypothetical protein
MILDTSAREIIERWTEAREEESAAIKRLHVALASKVVDQQTLRQLTEQMEQAHDRSTRIYQELQAARLDKR